MSRIETLRSASSLRDVAVLLGFRPSSVAYLLYAREPDENYKVFTIPKKTGGCRTIHAPIEGLKTLQRRLSNLLQDCIAEIQDGKGQVDRITHGFVRERSIVTNAQPHKRRRWVFNIDLEEFFPSINFGRIRGFLMKDRDFQLHERVATVIAQIACHNNSLPQGGPCSPVLSNLIGHVLDVRMVRLAAASGCHYTRYADDLTFSTNRRSFPLEIATLVDPTGTGVQTWEPSATLQDAIREAGFRINTRKTRLMYRFSRQEVTGLVVNEKLNVRREYRRTVRAMVHRLTTTGKFTIQEGTDRDGGRKAGARSGSVDELRGMLGFVYSIDRRHERTDKERRSRERAYRDFLMYTVFHAAERPVIVCEGKTDNTYLTHAIRGLASSFPALASVSKDNEVEIEVRLFRYSGTSTSSVLRLFGGGSGVLAPFIADYKTRTRKFTNDHRRHPVIIVYDKDKGAGPIEKVVRKGYKIPIRDGTFMHVYGNLYILGTPGASKIEDYFDAATKATKIRGKVFKSEKEEGFDTAQHYGKAVFARHVVAARAAQINFPGFRPLLEQLVLAIRHFRRIGH